MIRESIPTSTYKRFDANDFFCKILTLQDSAFEDEGSSVAGVKL